MPNAFQKKGSVSSWKNPPNSAKLGGMLETFFLRDNAELVERAWRAKNLLASEILGQNAHRTLRPEVVEDRTRLDLMSYESRLGIRGPAKGDGDFSFDFFELRNPDTPHPGILQMMEELRQRPIPEKLAQVRFRFHPVTGAQGLWLDISNESIKNLLEEEKWLIHFLQQGWVIEMGQKGKEAVLDGDNGVAFRPAQARRWIDSYDKNNEELPLVSRVSSFSQPGPEANRAMIAAGLDLLDEFRVKARSFSEFGAGYGNLTAAYASLFTRPSWASELDGEMAEILSVNQPDFFPKVALQKTKAQADLQDLSQYDLCLIDPPRPGFPELFQGLIEKKSPLPQYFLCYHCHSRGLLGDSQSLRKLNYKLKGWSSVDVFAATQHIEVVSLWELA